MVWLGNIGRVFYERLCGIGIYYGMKYFMFLVVVLATLVFIVGCPLLATPSFRVDYDEVKILYFGGNGGDSPSNFFSSTRKYIPTDNDSSGGFYVTSKNYLIDDIGQFKYSYFHRDGAVDFLRDADAIIVVAYSNGYECSRAFMDYIASKSDIEPIRYYFLIDGVPHHQGTDLGHLCGLTHRRNSFEWYWNFAILGGFNSVETKDGLSDTEGRLIKANGWCQRNELSDLTNCHAAIDNQLVDPSIEMFIKQCLGYRSSSTEADCYRTLLYREYGIGINEYRNISDSVDVTQYSKKEQYDENKSIR